MSKSQFKMDGFSGFGNSPLKGMQVVPRDETPEQKTERRKKRKVDENVSKWSKSSSKYHWKSHKGAGKYVSGNINKRG